MNSKQKNRRQNLCRLCLGVADSHMSIFRSGFQKMIKIISNLQIDPLDDLPKIVCLKCTKQVKAAVLLRKRILWSDRYLKVHFRKLLEKQNYIFESDSDSSSNDEEILIITEPNDKEVGDEYDNPHVNKNQATDLNLIKTANIEEINKYGYSDMAHIDEEYNSNLINTVNIEEINKYGYSDMAHIDEEYNSNLINTVNIEEINEYGYSDKAHIDEESDSNLIKTDSIKEINEHGYSDKAQVDEESDLNLIKTDSIEEINEHGYSGKAHIDKSEAICSPEETSISLRKILPAGKMSKSLETDKSRMCPICKKEYSNNSLLYMHLRTHDGPVDCPFCGKSYKYRNSLKKHVLYSHKSEGKPIVCHICGKTYKRRYVYNLHLKSHLNKKESECSICGKKFHKSALLRRHVKQVHEQIKPHICQYCSKSYPRKDQLTTHLRFHSEELSFGCEVCDQKFKHRSTLKNHLRNVHKIEATAVVFCSKCDKGFPDETALTTHFSRAHELEKCTFCLKVFATEEFLLKHVQEMHLEMG